MKGRLVALVVGQGSLGILVKDQSGSPLIPLKNFPGMTRTRAPSVIKNAMALMAMSAASHRETLINCLYCSIVMSGEDTNEEKHKTITDICGEATANQLIFAGWDTANGISEKVFQGENLTTLLELCALHFPDDTLDTPATLQ